MTDKKDEALKLALEALEAEHSAVYGTSRTARAITAIREALAEEAHYKKVIDDVQALFEAILEESAIWQAAYETEKGFREQEKQELASASVEPVARCMEHGECFGGECIYTSPQPAQQQEPVAYAVYHRMGGSKSLHWPEQHSPDGDANQYQLVPLYTSPPASKPWAGLTEEDLEAAMPGGIYDCLADPWDCGVGDGDYMRSIKNDVVRIIRAIEAKLKEKNHG